VPAQAVLARGTCDPEADAALLGRLDARAAEIADAPTSDDGWGEIPGEIILFDDPVMRLPLLDRLEGFRPGMPSLYDRVVLPVRHATAPPLAAWAYVRGRRAR
jgi:hypothetical protein